MNVKPMLKRLFFQLTPQGIRTAVLEKYYLSRLKSYSKNGMWESIERDMEIVKYFVASGDSVIDVGANFGFYTVFLSNLAGDKGNVYSFEPIPLTYEILSNNVRSLSLANVKAFGCAISEKDGPGVMVIPKWSASGGENFYQASIQTDKRVGGQFREVQVCLKKLDSLFYGHERKIAFVKIDVEGHELQVIEGAKSLISQSKPVLLIEIWGSPDDQQSSAFALFEQLKREGYDAYWYDGIKFRHRSSGDRSVNYFFLTKDQLGQLMRAAEGTIPCS
jgi:FkbM family methyltransferase